MGAWRLRGWPLAAQECSHHSSLLHREAARDLFDQSAPIHPSNLALPLHAPPSLSAALPLRTSRRRRPRDRQLARPAPPLLPPIAPPFRRPLADSGGARHLAAVRSAPGCRRRHSLFSSVFARRRSAAPHPLPRPSLLSGGAATRRTSRPRAPRESATELPPRRRRRAARPGTAVRAPRALPRCTRRCAPRCGSVHEAGVGGNRSGEKWRAGACLGHRTKKRIPCERRTNASVRYADDDTLESATQARRPT